jgi:hypothetical protein
MGGMEPANSPLTICKKSGRGQPLWSSGLLQVKVHPAGAVSGGPGGKVHQE